MKRSQAKLKEQRRKNKQSKGLSRGVSNYATKRRAEVNPDSLCEDCEFGLKGNKSVPRYPERGQCSVVYWKDAFTGLSPTEIGTILDNNGQGCPEFSRAIL